MRAICRMDEIYTDQESRKDQYLVVRCTNGLRSAVSEAATNSGSDVSTYLRGIIISKVKDDAKEKKLW